MKIGDKAEEIPEVLLASQTAPGIYRLDDDELVPADEISPEGEFPKWGDYLRATNTAGDDVYVECPSALAQGLIREDIEVGDLFRVRTADKRNDRWHYKVERGTESEEEEFAMLTSDAD